MNASQRLQLQMLLQNGIFAVLLVAAAGLGIWLVKDSRVQWDLTAGQRNSLSDATRKVLENMKGPLKITAYATTRDAMQGNLRQQIAEFVAPYQRAKPDLNLADLALTLFGPERGVELDIPPRDAAQDRPPPDFAYSASLGQA